MKTEHILIIRFSAIGDVAMTVPVVYSLAHQHPDLRITMLSRPFARPLFEYLPSNVSFMQADLSRDYNGVKGLNALYRRLTAKRFTAVADLHNVLRSEYLRIRFNLDRYRVAHVDKHRSGRKQLTSTTNKVLEQQPTPFQNYADVLAELGYPVNLEFTSIFPEMGGNMKLLPGNLSQKASTERWIGIAPFAAHTGKVYPLDKMEHVIDLIIKDNPTSRVFIFGKGDENEEFIKNVTNRHKNCLNVATTLDGLRQELILMSHLDVMLSMDSANTHLASLVNTPVVSVWGATHPFTGFMGWNQDKANVVQADLPCRPCSIFGNKPCMRGDYACMSLIAPETIVKHVQDVLNGN